MDFLLHACSDDDLDDNDVRLLFGVSRIKET